MTRLPGSDDLMGDVSALAVTSPAEAQGGRPLIPDRAALTGTLFVFKTGLPWEHLHRTLPERLAGAGQLDWSRAALDSARPL